MKYFNMRLSTVLSDEISRAKMGLTGARAMGERS
jgi:hypothetical protein